MLLSTRFSDKTQAKAYAKKHGGTVRKRTNLFGQPEYAVEKRV